MKKIEMLLYECSNYRELVIRKESMADKSHMLL